MRQNKLWLGAVSLLPEMFEALSFGVSGRALSKDLATLSMWNPRDFTHDVHHTVDDRPFGGGPGMVMKPEPIFECVGKIQRRSAKGQKKQAHVVLLDPQGKPIGPFVTKPEKKYGDITPEVDKAIFSKYMK